MASSTTMQEVDDLPFPEEIEKLGKQLIAEKENIDAVMLITISSTGRETVALLGEPENIRTVLEHSRKSVEMVLAAVPVDKKEVN